MNVKPGDLAIVIWASATPENIGRIVEIVKPATQDDICDEYDGPMWIVRSSTDLVVEYQSGRKGLCKERPMRDSMLKPVSGLPDEQHTEEHNKLEA